MTLNVLKISKSSIRVLSSFLLIGVILALWHFKVEPFYKFSLMLNDVKYNFNPHKPSDEILFLAVDEKSVTQFGRWPWDREFLAHKLEKLSAAKVVAFDMVFSEPTQTNKDLQLASSIEDLDNTICGIFLRNDSTKIFTAQSEEILRESALHRVFVQQLPFLKFKSAEVNIEPISQNCVLNGVFSTVSDSDSLFRRYPIGFLYNNFVYPSLGIQLLRYDLNKDIIIEQNENTNSYNVTFADKNIKIDQDGFIKLNYYNLDDYKIVSFADFVKDDFDISIIENKIVVLGISEAGVSDIRATPLGQIPGPLLHYTFISNFMQDILLKPHYYLELGLILFFSLIPIFLYNIVKNINIRILFYAISIATIIFISLFAYVKFNLWIDMFYILLGHIILLAFNGIFIFKTKDLETKFIKGAFSNYLSENLLEQLMKDPKKLKLGGEQREVSIIFTDIRGFTTLSESVTPEKLIEILELYFTPMTQLVLQNNGTLDKYIGDAIMAFYNAPIEVKDHERCAVSTALQMLEELKNINQELSRRNLPNVDFGAGINTGDAIVGNIGSKERFDYSVIGDSVNVASRVEGLCKTYKAHIIITENTKKNLTEDEFLIRELDTVTVRGKHTGIKLYQVLIDTDENRQMKKLYDQAMEKYYGKELQKAKELFMQCFEKYNDETAKLFVENKINTSS
jgi:adenylate cyclase